MIDLSHVHYQYEGAPYQALKDISLSISQGELIAIVGHNGSGKSTLCKMFNALLLPTSGTVFIDGMDTRDENCTLPIRQKVGMVFQNPDNQLVTSIVEEDVGFGPENLGVPPDQIRVRVDAALKEVGMTEFAASAGYSLSGGQKQRVAIAGMLAMRPDVLVLDEATAMLDPKGRQEVLSTVTRLNREEGMTVIMITQFMEEAALCGRVVVLSGGELKMDGTPRAIFDHAQELRQMGLDVPAAVQLRDELAAAGILLEGRPMNMEELADSLCR